MLLFVYGTLMSGGEASGKMSGASLMGPAETAPDYRLEELGPGFVVLEEGGSEIVSGELWDVDEAKISELRAWEYSLYHLGEVCLSDGTMALAFLGSEDLTVASRVAALLCART